MMMEHRRMRRELRRIGQGRHRKVKEPHKMQQGLDTRIQGLHKRRQELHKRIPELHMRLQELRKRILEHDMKALEYDRKALEKHMMFHGGRRKEALHSLWLFPHWGKPGGKGSGEGRSRG